MRIFFGFSDPLYLHYDAICLCLLVLIASVVLKWLGTMQCALNAFCVSATASSTEDAADPWTRRLGSWWFRIHARKIKYRKGAIHGMEEFRSPGQPYPYSWSIVQPPIKFWYSICGLRWWKNLESCVFYSVEFRPDSAIVSCWPRTITLVG